VDSALIVSCGDKGITYLSDMLARASVGRIVTVKTVAEARGTLLGEGYDLCIINAPLDGEFGDVLARSVAAKGRTEVILIVRAEVYEDVSAKVENDGVLTVAKPVNPALLWGALKLAQASHKRLQNIHNENQRLLQKIEDIRIIDRAKCALIAYFTMTEPVAHKYIEKQAMDMRVTRRAVAEQILKTYEN
jgi:response regulator NasT